MRKEVDQLKKETKKTRKVTARKLEDVKTSAVVNSGCPIENTG